MRIFLFILIVIASFSFVDRKREVVLTANAAKPIGPYSQAIRQSNTLYISGQVAIRRDGTIDTTSIENETRQALNNLSAIVQAGGMQLKDVAKVTVYCTDLRNFSRINEVYKTFFPVDPPARETVQVQALPLGVHLEISAIAAE